MYPKAIINSLFLRLLGSLFRGLLLGGLLRGLFLGCFLLRGFLLGSFLRLTLHPGLALSLASLRFNGLCFAFSYFLFLNRLGRGLLGRFLLGSLGLFLLSCLLGLALVKLLLTTLLHPLFSDLVLRFSVTHGILLLHNSTLTLALGGLSGKHPVLSAGLTLLGLTNSLIPKRFGVVDDNSSGGSESGS